MAIQLQTFLQAARARYGLRLLAGRGGLAHEFTWACLLEDIGNAGFLRGGELVITTGLAALQEHWLRDFVHALEGRQAAALILNTGKYLRESDITDEVRAFCEAHSFPLLLMPWQTHIADLMQEVCALLMEQAQKERRTEQLLCALLDDTAAPKPPAGETVLPLYPGASGRPVLLTGRQLAALRELTERGFHPRRFTLTVFDLGAPLAPPEDADLSRRWRRALAGLPLQLFFFRGAPLLLRELPEAQEADALPLAALAAAAPPPALLGGESDPHTDLAALPAAYREARAALIAARTGLCETGAAQEPPPKSAAPALLPFRALGVYRLLFTHPDRALLRAYAEEHLGALHRYDAAHHARLAETLRHYLLTGGSLAQTAARTYTHRNTAGYRIHKVKELTHATLAATEERFAYLLAFAVERFEASLAAEERRPPA